jgi:hypothetical protein
VGNVYTYLAASPSDFKDPNCAHQYVRHGKICNPDVELDNIDGKRCCSPRVVRCYQYDVQAIHTSTHLSISPAGQWSSASIVEVIISLVPLGSGDCRATVRVSMERLARRLSLESCHLGNRRVSPPDVHFACRFIIHGTAFRDAEIRSNVYKSLLLNSISLTSIYAFDFLLLPLVQDQQKWFHRNIGWFYQTLWLLPVVGLSFYLNVSIAVLVIPLLCFSLESFIFWLCPSKPS